MSRNLKQREIVRSLPFFLRRKGLISDKQKMTWLLELPRMALEQSPLANTVFPHYLHLTGRRKLRYQKLVKRE
jgi:hypothetical protein